jgi:hypothetical protein
MKTATVTYRDEEHDVRLVVAEATAETGIIRDLLLSRIQKEYGAIDTNSADVATTARGILSYLYYPSLVAATIESEGIDVRDMQPEDLAKIPRELFVAWRKVVFDLNPEWRPKSNASEEDTAEKKDAENAASESETG